MLPNLGQVRKLTGNTASYAIQQKNGYFTARDEDGNDLPLTTDVLKEHLAGEITVGSYLGKGDRSRQLVFDIDGDPDDLVASGIETDHIQEALAELGVPAQSIGVEFSGHKGFHVWVIFAAPQKMSELRRLGRAVCALANVKCEVFPKQDEVTEYGNLVGLPGGINVKSGKRREFVSAFPRPLGGAVLARIVAGLPEEPKPLSSGENTDGFPCVAHAFAGVKDGSRNRHLFQLAVHLRRTGVPLDKVDTMVRGAADDCVPPYPGPDDSSVDSLLRSAANSGLICGQLEGSPGHCGDSCVLSRSAGLTTRERQLQYAQPGETVVVEVEERTTEPGAKAAKRIRVNHPDAKMPGLIVLK